MGYKCNLSSNLVWPVYVAGRRREYIRRIAAWTCSPVGLIEKYHAKARRSGVVGSYQPSPDRLPQVRVPTALAPQSTVGTVSKIDVEGARSHKDRSEPTFAVSVIARHNLPTSGSGEPDLRKRDHSADCHNVGIAFWRVRSLPARPFRHLVVVMSQVDLGNKQACRKGRLG